MTTTYNPVAKNSRISSVVYDMSNLWATGGIMRLDAMRMKRGWENAEIYLGREPYQHNR